MNFNSYFTIKHTSNLRILLLTLFFIVPLGTIYGQNQLITIAGKNHYGICKILRMRELCIKFKK